MAGLADLQSKLAGYFGYLPRLEGHPESGMPPLSPGLPPTEQFPRGPFDPEITPLTPVPRPPLTKDLSFQVDPSAPPLAALSAMFPYLQRPTGLASMQPNAAGKLPEVDPLAGWQPMLQGALDVASFAGPEMAAKAAPAALHLLPMARESFQKEFGTTYKVIDDLAQHVMDLTTTFNPKTKRLYIDWVGRPGSEFMSDEELRASAANTIGPKELRSLVGPLRQEYPDMRSLTGERVTGARLYASMDEKGRGAVPRDPVLHFSGPSPPYSSVLETQTPAVRAAIEANERHLDEIQRLRNQ